jgi:hypothetical protein
MSLDRNEVTILRAIDAPHVHPMRRGDDFDAISMATLHVSAALKSPRAAQRPDLVALAARGALRRLGLQSRISPHTQKEPP